MNYINIYGDLCLSRMLLKRNKKDDYYENHHYLPKSLGGSNIPQNLVLLTPREHYIAHFLLYKIFKQTGTKTEMHKMAFAFNMMTISNDNQTRYNSHTYSIARKAVSKIKRGITPWNKDKKGVYSPETLKRISETSKNRKSQLGLKRSDETKRKIGAKSKDRGKKVYQYDLQGNFIKEYITAKVAGESTGKNTTSIIKCCNKQLSHYSGFIWRYTYRKKIKSTFKPVNKPILQYDLEGNFIKEWSGQREILMVLGIHDTGRVCKGINKTAGGYLWRYKEE